MAFNVGDVVRKVSGIQKYQVVEVLDGSKYKCKYYPNAGSASFVFKEADLVIVS